MNLMNLMGVGGHVPQEIFGFGPSESVSDGVLSKNVSVSDDIHN